MQTLIRRHAADVLRPTEYGWWELRVQRTVPIPADLVWGRLLDEWLPRWLAVDVVPPAVGAPLLRKGAYRGRVVACQAGRAIRTCWLPESPGDETVLRITLERAPGGTTIAIHQERLQCPVQRQGMLERWTSVLDGMTELIADEAAPSGLGSW